ncbi:MAG: hypothetical protein WCC87_23155 [Candidatus Korobacteraceae bacterium]
MSRRRSVGSWPKIAAPVVLGGLAALLLLWGLGNKYLWQDEAATAVLAERMLRFGRPLAYDGVNLITIDHIAADDANTIDERTANPKAAIDFYIRRGDFKPDTAWKWHPWGQFVVAAISLKLFGPTTLAARLPFALAGIVTVLLLYQFVLVRFDSPLMAWLAALLLVCNSYWILHSRQARYYSLSSLLLVLTLMAYARWQTGGRWGAAAFVVAAWCWFQVDYGTLWPVLLVLFVDAFIAQRRQVWRPFLVGVALTAAMAPFIYYFELWRRASKPVGSWSDRFQVNLFNMNEYLVPVLVVLAAIVMLKMRWQTLAETERRLVVIAIAILVAYSLWVPLAVPYSFLRYVIIITPVGCLLAAWVLVRGCEGRIGLAWAGAAVLILTPWLSKPLHPFIQRPPWYRSGAILKPELSTAVTEIFGNRPDPNRLVVEWLRQNSQPGDEILINYEDVPLMFYLPNPIRGGVAAFRVEDDSKSPPEFLILRQSVRFVHWPIFRRELLRYQWQQIPLEAPDVPWGNNPDPMAESQDPDQANSLYIARRVK